MARYCVVKTLVSTHSLHTTTITLHLANNILTQGTAPKRTKIALDLRNHGRSPHSPDTSYASIADDVAAFLRAKDIERAVVVGHSFGGKTAMTLALRESALVESLVVVDIAPVTYNPSHDPDGSSAATCLPAMLAADVANAVSRSEVEHALTVNGVVLPAVRSFLLANLVAGNGDGFRWRCAVDTLHNGLKEIMSFPDFGDARYKGRTMLIRGGKSRYVPFSAMRTHTQMFPNTKLVTLSDAGHWLMSEQPNAFVNQVNKFIKEQ